MSVSKAVNLGVQNLNNSLSTIKVVSRGDKEVNYDMLSSGNYKPYSTAIEIGGKIVDGLADIYSKVTGEPVLDYFA